VAVVQAIMPIVPKLTALNIAYYTDPDCTIKAHGTFVTQDNSICYSNTVDMFVPSLGFACVDNAPFISEYFEGALCAGEAPYASPFPQGGCQLLPGAKLFAKVSCEIHPYNVARYQHCDSPYGCCADTDLPAQGPGQQGCPTTHHTVWWGIYADVAAATLTINVGDSVTWVFTDPSIPHTVTSGTTDGDDFIPDGKFANGAPSFAPYSFTATFDTPGEFPYFCIIHPDFMTGVITVVTPTVPTTAAVVVTTAPPANEHIIPWGLQFFPDTFSITINVGDTVTWVFENPSDPPVPHTVESGTNNEADGTFSSGAAQIAGSYSYTFNTAGEYPYFCGIHFTVMIGTITVLDITPD